ncbi:MAG: DUF2232 domain-containing protein [Candidatus Rifleibacteriota bacterium]
MTGIMGSRTAILALMVVFTIIGLFAAVQIPFLGAIMLSFAGLPAFIILLAWGGTWFLIYSFVTVVLAGLMGNLSLAFFLIPLLLVPAAVLSAAVKLKYSPMKAIAVTLFVSTVFSSLCWALAVKLEGNADKEVLSVEKHFSQQVSLVETKVEKMEKNGELTPESAEAVKESVRQTFDFMIKLVPVTFIFIWHLISLAIIYIYTRKLAPRLSLSLVPLPPFATWRFDYNFIWLFIGGWVLFYVAGDGDFSYASNLRAIGANMIAISKIIYFIAGLSLLFFMFDKYKISKLSRVSFSLLALIFTQAIVWFGIIDIWADFRTPKSAIISSGDSDDS